MSNAPGVLSSRQLRAPPLTTGPLHYQKLLVRGCLIFVLAAVSAVAFAQQRAITDDGKTVLLFPDGTWKAAGEVQKPDRGKLAIDVGIVYETGPRPVARQTFYLLDTSLAELVAPYITLEDRRYADSHGETSGASRFQIFAAYLTYMDSIDMDDTAVKKRQACVKALAAIRKHIVSTATTDFTGKASFEAQAPGKYYLAGFVVTPGKTSMVWNITVALGPGLQSMVLDQNNASARAGY